MAQDEDEAAEGVAQSIQSQVSELLARILPDDTPDWVVSGAISGMCGAIILDMWARCAQLPEDRDRLKEAWRTIGESIIDQLPVETMQ